MLAWAAWLRGLGMGGGLIVAIGAQNAYVLRQGILKQQVLTVVLVCCLCDIALISCGILGMGEVIEAHPTLAQWAKWGGAAFLAWYGLRSALKVFDAKHAGMAASAPTSTQGALLTALAFSLLNPHVYLDTVVLLGSIGAQEGPRRIWFGSGAVTASLLWFFSLGYGAQMLAPVFQRPLAWRILDGVIACTMWALAVTLIW